jgi:hypothetical protein
MATQILGKGAWAPMYEWLGELPERAFKLWWRLALEQFKREANGHLEISHEELARLHGCSISKVQRGLTELHEAGAIAIANVCGSDGKEPNIYYLALAPNVFPDTSDVTEPAEKGEQVIKRHTSSSADASDVTDTFDASDVTDTFDASDVTDTSLKKGKKRTSAESESRFTCPTFSEEFEEVWNLYPFKKGNKLEACRGWTGWIEASEDAATLLLATTNYAEKVELNGTEERYVLNAQRFFGTEGCWTHYVDAPPPPTGPSKEEVVAQMTRKGYGALVREYEDTGYWPIPWGNSTMKFGHPPEHDFPQFADDGSFLHKKEKAAC